MTKIVKSFLVYSLLGLTLGAVAGMISGRAGGKFNISSDGFLSGVLLHDHTQFSALAGLTMGVCLFLLKPIRRRGRRGKYVSWVVASYVAFGALNVRDLTEPGWEVGLFVLLFIGLGTGLSLGLMEEFLRKEIGGQDGSHSAR